MKTTKKQQQILLSIQQYIQEHKYPPTIRDICEMAGLKSSSTAHGYLERLKRQGLIE